MERCAKCGKPINKPLVTLYGESRCENCWDDYLMTDTGKVEYLYGIVRGDFPMDYFDADFLGHVAVCWKNHRDDLNLTLADLRAIETKAEAIGLL